MSPSPDLTRKVLGYRQFALDGIDLCSVAVPARWMPGVNRARCERSRDPLMYGFQQPPPVPPHDAPSPDCACGLYALHEKPRAWARGGLERTVGAIVLGWGRMEVHRDGFRAEYAEVVRLVHDRFCGPALLKELLAVGEVYSAPVCDVETLDEVDLRELGESISKSLLPACPVPAIRPRHGLSPRLGIVLPPVPLATAMSPMAVSPHMVIPPSVRSAYRQPPSTAKGRRWWREFMLTWSGGSALGEAVLFAWFHGVLSLIAALICAAVFAFVIRRK